MTFSEFKKHRNTDPDLQRAYRDAVEKSLAEKTKPPHEQDENVYFTVLDLARDSGNAKNVAYDLQINATEYRCLCRSFRFETEGDSGVRGLHIPENFTLPYSRPVKSKPIKPPKPPKQDRRTPYLASVRKMRRRDFLATCKGIIAAELEANPYISHSELWELVKDFRNPKWVDSKPESYTRWLTRKITEVLNENPHIPRRPAHRLPPAPPTPLEPLPGQRLLDL